MKVKNQVLQIQLKISLRRLMTRLDMEIMKSRKNKEKKSHRRRKLKTDRLKKKMQQRTSKNNVLKDLKILKPLILIILRKQS